MKVLFVTSEWPTKSNPNDVPYLVEQIEYLRLKKIDATIFKINSGSIWSRLKSIVNLRCHILVTPYQIIHTHWGYNGLFSLGCKAHRVITFHGSDLNIPDNWNIKTIAIYFISKISTVISNYNVFVSKALLQKKLLNSKKETIIPMGINLRKFYPMNQEESRKKLKLSTEKKLILFGGNASQAVKRLVLARNAIEILGDNFELIIVDYINHKLIPFYMNAVDLLLMTSRSEGSPLMVKEALACNLPVVSTDVGDVQELIRGLENCHIIKNESPNAIAEIVKGCILKRTKPDGRKRIKSKYSIEKSSLRVLDVYNTLLKNKR